MPAEDGIYRGPGPLDIWLGGLDTSNDADYFVDGREGVDRWGRERKDLIACGTGWDGYVCPAYAEEACPGDRNPGDRLAPNRVRNCDLLCGACGGGGRTETMAYCGWSKGRKMFATAVAEMGGSLRLDRYQAPPAKPVPTFETSYVPSCEWYVKGLMPTLTEQMGGPWPMVATSVRTAYPGIRRDGQPLRERLGNYEGSIMVHGLAKDDVLDDRWDDRHRLMRWCQQQGVDTMVTPQFSYYEEDQNCMAVFNTNRIFRWYQECAELGFPHVALDWPPANMPWAREEYLDFILRNDVKLIAPSLQTVHETGGISPRFLADFRRLHAELPADVSVAMFGVGVLVAYVQIARMMPGRNLTFVNPKAYFAATQWKLLNESPAPPGWSKADAFAYNVQTMTQLSDRAISVTRESLAAEEEPKRARSSRRRGRVRPRASRQR